MRTNVLNESNLLVMQRVQDDVMFIDFCCVAHGQHHSLTATSFNITHDVLLDGDIMQFTFSCRLINSETLQKMHVTLLATEC